MLFSNHESEIPLSLQKFDFISSFTREQFDEADQKLFKAVKLGYVELYWRARSPSAKRAQIYSNDISDPTWLFVIKKRRTMPGRFSSAINYLADKVIEVQAEQIAALSFEDNQDLTAVTKTAKSSRTDLVLRHSKYDRIGLEAFLVEMLEENGDISYDDSGKWRNQADMEKVAADWYSENNLKLVPAPSTVRNHVTKIRERWLAGLVN
ncbi:MAG: hypothetical protein GY761_19640 [Hyphomicrobiales bacterium]|nr:hypothetical protein [Hyphomicrobiales bacterium]